MNSKTFAWEAALPGWLRARLGLERIPERTDALPESGRGGEVLLPGFPNVPTSKLGYTPAQANVVADLAGWLVKRHEKLFREVFR